MDRALEVMQSLMILKLQARSVFHNGDAKRVSILLTFEVRDGKNAIRYEPDPRRAEIPARGFELSRPNAEGVSTLGEKSGARLKGHRRPRTAQARVGRGALLKISFTPSSRRTARSAARRSRRRASFKSRAGPPGPSRLTLDG